MRTTVDLNYDNDIKIIDMKVLGIVSFVLAIVSLAVVMYCQIEIAPNYEAFDKKNNLQEFEKVLWSTYADQKFLLSSVALFVGPIAVFLGLIVGLKKHKIGWIALSLGLISFLLGAIQSTYVFN